MQVFVRCRPLNCQEKAAKSFSVVQINGAKEIVVKGNPISKAYQFDRYNFVFYFNKCPSVNSLRKIIVFCFRLHLTFCRSFGPGSSQSEVYSTVVSPMISQVVTLKGNATSVSNCSIFIFTPSDAQNILLLTCGLIYFIILSFSPTGLVKKTCIANFCFILLRKS